MLATATSLPALLLVLNLGGSPDDAAPRGSAPAAESRESTDVGFARVHINRNVRFLIDDERAGRKLKALEKAGRPPAARDLPRRLPMKRSYSLQQVCNPTQCGG